MQYKIEGTPLPVVICNLDAGAQMIAELKQVCDRLKVAGTFAPRSEL